MDTLSYLKKVRVAVLQEYCEKQAETTWANRHELDELFQEIHLANLEMERYQRKN